MMDPLRAGILPLLIIALLAAGCVMEPLPDNRSATGAPTPVPGSTPPAGPATIPTSAGPVLKGKVTISTGGWPGEFPVSVDTVDAGTVAADRPLDLMLEEGNHTIGICCNMRCEEEIVDIRFGRQKIVDFSDQLKRDFRYAAPTVLVSSYTPLDDRITIDLEFFNPAPRPLAMSADVSVAYSYIDRWTYNRAGGIVHRHVTSDVDGCDRATQTVQFTLADGHSYVYDNFPTVTNITSA